MTDIEPENEIKKKLHDIINTRLYPARWLVRIGQVDEYNYREADFMITRTGNLHSAARKSATYTYRITGDGFVNVVRAVWPAGDCTADVTILSVSPIRDGEQALLAWLVSIGTPVSAAVEEAAAKEMA